MVAKISSGTSLFGALKYNQDKVDEGVAEVLFSQNIIRPLDGSYDIYSCMRSFEPYLMANNKTQKPLIHISLNPHPDDKLTDEQLSTIAQEYMDKLGYGSQPYLVYKHSDLKREHIHIVSVRVDENGKKINDSFEKRRSDEIRKELEKKYNLLPAEAKQHLEYSSLKKIDLKAGNTKKQISNITKALMKDYRFQSVNEYKALLSVFGVTVEEVKGEIRGKVYNGLVYSALNSKGEKTGSPIKASLIGKAVGYEALEKRIAYSQKTMKDKAVYDRTKAIVSKIMNGKSNRKTFEKELEKNGISVLFRQNDDKRIYGVTFIDHQEKTAFNGSKMGKEFSANVFHTLFNEQNKHTFTGKDNDKSQDFNYDYSPEQSSITESLGSLFSMEQHGDNYEEIAFTSRMKRKKRRKFGRQM